ncbi:hypothetical protein FHX08_000518 [Rhizobium sp. BK529]|uniref:hypothetical protein n=1 Tax=unclassified Rhizobium TaxID=2613769 RepID=UPI00104EBBB8|nr:MULTISPECIES: hypothetical protein [unclassified Rhizobium]MBB3590174.1 hypothetical protein [Rhizobium sp. BK529]TCS04869.1 hypothetical protein EV281_103548 [Rhizobium sp. BK418]
MSDKDKIRKDAEGQFARTDEGRRNSGVSGAKPRDITHSDDATIHRTPPGEKSHKDWSVKHDEANSERSRPA